MSLQKAATAAFFAAYLGVGLGAFRDYGMSRDEPISRFNGIVVARYVAETFTPAAAATDPRWKEVPRLEEWVDKDYGVLFDLPAYWAERLLRLTDKRDVYFLRHLLTFLLFYAGTFAFYLLVKRRFESGWMGLLGAALLAATPRVFAESFYNSKDILFLSAYILGLYSLARFLDRKSAANGLLLGLASAVAISLRVPGVMVPAIALLFTVVDAAARRPGKTELRALATGLGAFAVSAAVLTVALYPYLWHDPVARFVELLRSMGRFRWTGTVLYLGRAIKATELPWHYIPVWMLITIPPVYTLFFVLGLVGFERNVLKAGLRDGRARLDALFVAAFALPLLGVIVFRSVLYDGWRQMYFIYAPFLLVALSGVRFVLDLRASPRKTERITSRVMAAVLAAGMAVTAFGMAANHPHQNAYFNSLVPRERVESGFDRDYWGLSYRRGLEHILAVDTRDSIGVAFNYHTDSFLLLKPEERRRLERVEPEGADYLLSEYRWHPEEYPPREGMYNVYSYGVKILTVIPLK
jgi:4-amino-4-deoxy-L-arabinose transferase-like glycosyltransferase